MDEADSDTVIMPRSSKEIIQAEEMVSKKSLQVDSPSNIVHGQLIATPTQLQKSSATRIVNMSIARVNHAVSRRDSPIILVESRREIRKARLAKLKRKVAQRRMNLSLEHGQLTVIRKIQQTAKQRFRGLDVSSLNALQRRLIYRMANKWTLNNISEDDKKIVDFSHAIYTKCQRSYEYLNGWLMFPTARFQSNLNDSGANAAESQDILNLPSNEKSLVTCFATISSDASEIKFVVKEKITNNVEMEVEATDTAKK